MIKNCLNWIYWIKFKLQNNHCSGLFLLLHGCESLPIFWFIILNSEIRRINPSHPHHIICINFSRSSLKLWNINFLFNSLHLKLKLFFWWSEDEQWRLKIHSGLIGGLEATCCCRWGWEMSPINTFDLAEMQIWIGSKRFYIKVNHNLSFGWYLEWKKDTSQILILW